MCHLRHRPPTEAGGDNTRTTPKHKLTWRSAGLRPVRRLTLHRVEHKCERVCVLSNVKTTKCKRKQQSTVDLQAIFCVCVCVKLRQHTRRVNATHEEDQHVYVDDAHPL